jgi:hypothetical protein
MAAVAEEFADRSDPILEAKSAAFRTDLPSITDALKSMLSVMLAAEFTRPPLPAVTHMRGNVVLGPVQPPELNQASSKMSIRL